MQIIITEIWDALIVMFLADFYFLFSYLFTYLFIFLLIYSFSYLFNFIFAYSSFLSSIRDSLYKKSTFFSNAGYFYTKINYYIS